MFEIASSSVASFLDWFTPTANRTNAAEEVLQDNSSRSYLSSRASFQLFSQLPTELRLKIWRHCMPDGRILILREGEHRNGHFRAQQWVTRWASPTPPPAVLQVCKESRLETLPFYQLSFGRNGFPAHIYANFDRDVLCFDGADLEGVMLVNTKVNDLQLVKRLAVNFEGIMSFSWAKLHLLGKLEEIILVKSLNPKPPFPELCLHVYEEHQSEDDDLPFAKYFVEDKLEELSTSLQTGTPPVVRVGRLILE